MMKYYSPLILIGLCILFVSCGTSQFYLVRHAEKMDNTKNPVLSPAGEERAKALKDLLLTASIQRIFSSDYHRTKMTAAPLATTLGLSVEIYPAGETFQLVERLKAMKKTNVLVTGHSNTVPEMVKHFTGEEVKLGHDDYHYLFVIEQKQQLFKTSYSLQQKTVGQLPDR